MITDAFYVKLGADPEQSRLIEGRVDARKRTHNRWWVEAVTSFLRTEGLGLLTNEIVDAADPQASRPWSRSSTSL